MSGESILVVDDDESIRETLVRELGRGGYEMSAADSAETAVARVRELEPELVITDLRMRGMSGLDLLDWLRKTVPDVAVIVITAHQDMETALQAIKKGAQDFLVKPLDLDQIELVVARTFKERSLRRMRQLAHAAAEPYRQGQLIGRDPAMIAISKTIGALAATRAPVLLRGETGTGKEVVARTIHFTSDAAVEPFVAINCTAIPEALLESELFGHVRGSFTGAANDRKGRFELAGAGTVFLDEIGDVSPIFQTKLLRVLQDGEFYPVGAERPRRTAARVIAATHRPLEELVRDGRFREDLYFRLRVVEITIPPLRERRGDVPALADALLTRISGELHRGLHLPERTRRALMAHDWPGNVRELENALRRAAVLSRTGALEVEDLSLGTLSSVTTAPSSTDLSLAAATFTHVERVLASTGGNKRQAARVLGISRQRLDRLLAHDVDSERSQDGNESQPVDRNTDGDPSV